MKKPRKPTQKRFRKQGYTRLSAKFLERKANGRKIRKVKKG